jgi:hypothetical protein
MLQQRNLLTVQQGKHFTVQIELCLVTRDVMDTMLEKLLAGRHSPP